MRIRIAKAVAGLTLLLSASSLSAQQSASGRGDSTEYPPVYRLEVIVLSHADGRSDRIRSNEPLDFTERLNPLLIAQANDAAERQLTRLSGFLPITRIPDAIDASTPRLEAEGLVLSPIPPVYSALGDLSRPIIRALDRLLDAPEYDPVTSRAWIQLAERGGSSAIVRIHDQNVVDLIEPEDDGRLIPLPHVLPFGPLVKTPPPALDIYRLDGTLRLRRRQFLHLDLDLVWQTQARGLSDRVPGASPPPVANGDAPGADGEWLLHRLQQSRIVEPGRFEYFDSSRFGVLVRIERFDQVVPKIAVPEPDAPGPNPSGSAETVEPVTNSGL